MDGTIYYQFYKCLGVPVATVALDGASNAGILAAQILATNDKEIMRKLGIKRGLKARSLILIRIFNVN